MIEWIRFAVIILIAAAEYAWHETVRSSTTTYDFFRYRVRWTIQEKLQTMWARRHR